MDSAASPIDVKTLFTEPIDGWASWARVYQFIPAFTPLVQHIFQREQLPFAPLTPLPPGTHGVFRSGPYVIKLFCPAESGLDSSADYRVELYGCQRAMALGVPTCKVVAHGVVDTTYVFRYIIMRYVESTPGGAYLKACTGKEQRESFVRQLWQAMETLHRPSLPVGGGQGQWEGPTVQEIALQNDKWRETFRPSFLAQVEAEARHLLSTLSASDLTYVHGDLTGENTLVDAEGTLYLIDFADAMMAPDYYEYASIVVELFDLNPELTRCFMGTMSAEVFSTALYRAIVLHDFGADFVSKICRLLLGTEPSALQELQDVRRALHDWVAQVSEGDP